MSCDDSSLGNNQIISNVHKSQSMPNLTENGCNSFIRKRSRRNIAKARNIFVSTHTTFFLNHALINKNFVYFS